MEITPISQRKSSFPFSLEFSFLKLAHCSQANEELQEPSWLSKSVSPVREDISRSSGALPTVTLTPSQQLLNDIRRLSGYSTRRLAKEINIPVETLRGITVGSTRQPRTKNFIKIMRFYCLLLSEKNNTSATASSCAFTELAGEIHQEDSHG